MAVAVAGPTCGILVAAVTAEKAAGIRRGIRRGAAASKGGSAVLMELHATMPAGTRHARPAPALVDQCCAACGACVHADVRAGMQV